MMGAMVRDHDGFAQDSRWRLSLRAVTLGFAILSGLVPLGNLARETTAWGFAPVASVSDQIQPKVVKIYGAGGVQRLESYQSGFFVSAEGHIVTVWSYVLDSDVITVVLHDGRRLEAKLLGADPGLELAVLKVEGTAFPHFPLSEVASTQVGAKVLAFSNIYGVAVGSEPVSVQHGIVSALTKLSGRRGVFETPYKGPVVVIDAITSNPGAAGGVLTNWQGQLIGMLGKELQDAANQTWFNYAIPIAELKGSIEKIMTGKFVAQANEDAAKLPAQPHTAESLGIQLVPDVVERTPPFVDRVTPGSPAALAGLRPDDLIVYLNERLVPSCRAFVQELAKIDRIDPVKFTILRNKELVETELMAPQGVSPTKPGGSQ